MTDRRTLLRNTWASALVAATGTSWQMAHAQASAWPSKPVRIIVPYPAGGVTESITRLLAERLGWHLLDSGALYRLVALEAIDSAVSLDAEAEIAQIANGLDVRFDTSGGEGRIWLRGCDVTQAIRTKACGQGASVVAVLPAVRSAGREVVQVESGI